MLQPNARRAPYPINRPPTRAAIRERKEMCIIGVIFLARLAATKAPIINPKFVNETESFNTLFLKACAGYDQVQYSHWETSTPIIERTLAPHNPKAKVTDQG